jgi:hypothetical protein
MISAEVPLDSLTVCVMGIGSEGEADVASTSLDAMLDRI